MKKRASLLIAVVALSGSLFAAEPIRYELRFPEPHTHYVEVRATFPEVGDDDLELMMAVWTPGSYLVREYQNQVEGLSATTTDGRQLEVRKTRKNRWVVDGGHDAVVISYRVYSRKMSVQGNWVDSEFSILNGAPTFITSPGRLSTPHDIEVFLPEAWTESITTLEKLGDHRYRARDFDELVDSPIYAGNPTVHTFTVGGHEHLLVNQGEDDLWDGEKSARDTATITRAQQDFWGTVPYDRYIYFNMIVDAGGGLEHKESTLMLTRHYQMRTRKDYVRWLGLVSHEFFHTWNVKRLRPQPLGPFDYENEVHTHDLWISEGFTSYFGPLLLRRGGLIDQKEYLESLSDRIEGLQTRPGRAVQSASSSSFDAWISLYRPNENSPNVAISYYTKGAIVGFLLDARIRNLTNNEKSLDDVMREAYRRFSGTRGFESGEFRQIASDVAGHDLSSWFEAAVDGTGELDYSEALEFYGLQFASEESKDDEGEDDGEADDDIEKGWLGLITSDSTGRLLVQEVHRGTPAYDAGFNAEDEILGIDDNRIAPDMWEDRLERYLPGDEVSILVARRGKLTRIDATLGEKPKETWKLEVIDEPTEEQAARLAAWLGDASEK